MARQAIDIRKLDRPGGGYRILPSWRLSKSAYRRHKIDAWMPELAPSLQLGSQFRKGNINSEAFNKLYASELRSPRKQNLIKPLALLSLRKHLVLLCDSICGRHCPNRVLLQALEACRKSGVFHLNYDKAA